MFWKIVQMRHSASTTDTFVFSPAAGAAKLFSAVDSEIMSGEREDGAQAREEEV